MKFFKVSLATVVALSAFSSIASATPLEEAIKNVDLSGFARYRYTSDKITSRSTGANHRFHIEAAFKSALDDNFFGVLRLRYDATDHSGSSSTNNGNPANDRVDTTTGFGVKEIYLGYKVGQTTVTAGKQLIGTYFDEDLAATGFKVTNSDISGLTLAALAFDAMEYNDGTNTSNKNGKDFDGKLGTLLAATKGSKNIYALAAIGGYDPISFQVWYANVSDIANLFALDAALKFNVSDVKLGLKAQYVHNESDSKEFGDANFYAFKGDLGAFGANLNAGYIGFKTQKDVGNIYKQSFVSIESNGQLINPSKIINGVMNNGSQYYNTIKDKNNYWFVGLGYKFDNFNLYANYINGKGYSWKTNFAQRVKRDEWNLGGSYKYSKKLTFSGFYAAAKEKAPNNTLKDNKQDRIRFEAKYSF